MGMILHCGGKAVEYTDLRDIELPEETRTYKPVAHYDLADNVVAMGNDILTGYEFNSAQHAVAKDGQRYFGVFKFDQKPTMLLDDGIIDVATEMNKTMRYNIAIRNSYDKSMSVGVAMGASVFICDNLALTGDIAIMRKHTTNIIADLEEMLITNIYRSKSNFKDIFQDSVKLKNTKIENDHAYKFLGLLYGNGIIQARQLPHAMKQWRNPVYEDFQDRNAWSLYNAVTDSLKSTPPNKIMENHIGLHRESMKFFA